MNLANTIYSRVSCKGCLAKINASPLNEHSYPNISALWDCGAHAEGGIGHEHRFTRDGRTALCVIPQRAQ